jgi:hypothetical protein
MGQCPEMLCDKRAGYLVIDQDFVGMHHGRRRHSLAERNKDIHADVICKLARSTSDGRMRTLTFGDTFVLLGFTSWRHGPNRQHASAKIEATLARIADRYCFVGQKTDMILFFWRRKSPDDGHVESQTGGD